MPILLPLKPIKWKIAVLPFLLVLLSSFSQNFLPNSVSKYLNTDLFASTTLTLTTKTQFLLGRFDSTEADSTEGSIKLRTVGTWGPRAMRTPFFPISQGTSFVSDGSNIYMLAYNDNYFSRYIPNENRWEELTRAPYSAGPGASLTILDNYIYAVFGYYSKYFARYSILTNTWEVLPEAAEYFYSGASLATDGTDIYALRGNGSTDFYKYDVSAQTWTIPLTNVPGGIGDGADLLYSGSDFYALQGGYTTRLYKYSTSAGSWILMPSAPSYIGYSNNADIKDGYIYTTGYYNFLRYNIAGSAWETLAAPPQSAIYGGVVYNRADNQIYLFQGNGNYNFWKYNTGSNTYQGVRDLPATPGSGSDLVYYGGYLYYPRGGNTAGFYRYNLGTDTWEGRSSAPNTFNWDTKGIVAGSSIYFLRGGGTQTFYQYSPDSDVWTTLANITSAADTGVALAYPGSGDYIYATIGNTTRGFARYSISGSSWTNLPGIPDNAEAYFGARLVSDGTNIYYLSGGITNKLLKYVISSSSWSQINTTLPYTPNWGTDASYYNGRIYVMAGYFKSDFYEYDIASNTWRNLDPLGQYYYYKEGPYNGASLESDGAGHFYATYGFGVLNMNLYTVNSQTYRSSGSWISNNLDLTHVSSWPSNAFSVISSTPGNSNITFETRSSADQITWSGWSSTASGSSIASPTNRYLQVKATFTSTSDFLYTPRLDAISLTYIGDNSPPSNPTTFTAKSTEIGGITITSEQSYPYEHPFFTWSGVSDPQTSVSGYYVYFGSDSGADPQVSGNFQTNASYLSISPITQGTYYLRIRTSDVVGNISDAVTGFTYSYLGVPSTMLSTSSSTVFQTGTLTNINAANNTIKLASSPGFWLEKRFNPTPASITYITNYAYVASTNKIYTFRGENTTTFYEYDFATDTWVTKASAPATVYYGGGAVEGPAGYIYGWRGTDSVTFMRYDIQANTWSDSVAADLPSTLSYGSTMIYDGNRYIYALRSNSDDAFYRYDTQDNEWVVMASTDFGAPTLEPNNLVANGGDMAYDGANTIYALQGSCRFGISSYSISQNKWTPMNNLPFGSCGYGQLKYDPTTQSLYYFVGNGKPYFYKYDTTAASWVRLADVPFTVYYGSAARVINGDIYMFRGAGYNTFYVYDISRNSWGAPSRGFFEGYFLSYALRAFDWGSRIIKGDGNNLYFARGLYDNQFIKYNPSTGVYTNLAPSPAGFYAGSTLVYDSVNNKIYAMLSYYLRALYVYDIATDAWSEVTTDPPPVDPGSGTSMVFDGSRYLYWARGSSTSTFYSYDTAGSAGARWTVRSAPPASLDYGSQLLYKNGKIYTLRGINVASNPFYMYTVSSGSWSTLSPYPDAAYRESFLVDGGDGYFYSCKGENSSACYRYSIAGSSWSQIASAPAQFRYGAAAATDGNSRIYVVPGAGTNTFTDGIYNYIIQTDSTSFTEQGTYISPVHDLSKSYRFNNISVVYTSAPNTTVATYTRTSADNVTWSAWVLVGDEKVIGDTHMFKINSTSNRYIQVKFILGSTDSIYSPIILRYTVHYQSDTDAPTNPSALRGAYDSITKDTIIDSGSWNSSSAPYFEWFGTGSANGPTDGETGSGVYGYYVYFGSDSGANPQSFGTLTTTASFQASNLNSGSSYYLLISTLDNAGNVNSSPWNAFTYKYDNQPPNAPIGLSADPSGYSVNNSYDFTWNVASDSGSGEFLYCYKTGASVGIYSTDQCISDTFKNDIPSYKSGANTFYIRTKDAANNYSSYTTVSFYYSSNAPSPPRNLIVSPSSSTENAFAVSWGAPEVFYGAEENLTYYYSVNALPTLQSSTATKLKALSSGPFATLPGENSFYVVAKDEAGNVDWGTYASATFTANTSAPGIPTAIDIADVSVKATSSWKLAISWELPTNVGAGVASYRIARSIDNVTFTDYASTAGASYVDTGLTQRTYYYKVKACDNANNCGSYTNVVSYLPDGKFVVAAPLVAEPEVTAITTKKATVSWTTSRTADSKVALGTKSGDYGEEEVANSAQVTDHTLTLTNLSPGTKYYMVAKWTDEDGNLGTSDEVEFQTLPAPSLTEVKAASASLYTATLQFTSKNGESAKIYYGTTTAFGGSKEVSVSTTESTYTIEISGLADGTKYYYKINLFDIEAEEYEGDTYSFETLPEPKVSNIVIEQIKTAAQPAVIILWDSNTEVSSVLTYYPEGDRSQTKDEINASLVTGRHRMVARNLLPERRYVFLVSGRDKAGNETKAEQFLYTTLADTRPPVILGVKAEGTSSTNSKDNENTKMSQLIITWKTDELSTSQIEYGEGSNSSYPQKTQEDGNLTLNHAAIISNLTPSKVYHFRVISKDKAGNVGKSIDNVTITPKSTGDALDLVVTNLSQVFSFVGNIKR
jgi:hypothetical protein